MTGLPPHGLRHVYGFAACNALSFQMVLGSPMILYAQSLGATVTQLGLIAGMLPLLNLLQIPAAKFVGRVGHKRFVLGGWSVRVGFIVLMALVPLVGKTWAPEVRLAAILLLLLCFNISRGVSACGWLPWITSLLPAHYRGRFLVREAATANLASLAAFLLAAGMLGPEPGPGRFTAIFAFSAVAGAASLAFLKRIPEDDEPGALYNAVTPVRLSEMLTNSGFRRLLVFTVAWSLASGGMLAFSVAFLRDASPLPDGKILLLNATTFLGGIATLFGIGHLVDRSGSRPLLVGTSAFAALVFLGWWALATGRLAALPIVVGILLFALGLAASSANLAATRLAMATIPDIGRSHYFAVYSVVGSLVLGLSPVLWGALADRIDGGSTKGFAVLFAGLAVSFLVSAVSALFLREPEIPPLEEVFEKVVARSRLRFWFRLWPRP